MLGIMCILLLDIVVLITWEAVDPIKSEAVNISIKVGKHCVSVPFIFSYLPLTELHFDSYPPLKPVSSLLSETDVILRCRRKQL